MVVSEYIWAVYNVLWVVLFQETAEIQFFLRGRFVCDVMSLQYVFCNFQIRKYSKSVSLSNRFGEMRDF